MPNCKFKIYRWRKSKLKSKLEKKLHIYKKKFDWNKDRPIFIMLKIFYSLQNWIQTASEVLLGSPSSAVAMSVSLSSHPAVRDRSLAVYPSLPGAHSIFHPLKSLGRMVTDAQTIMPFNFAGTPSFFSHNSHQTAVFHEQILNVSSMPYFQHMQPSHSMYPRHNEQSTGSPSEFSSPSSGKSSSASSSPVKDSLSCLQAADPSPEHTRTYSFTEEDLFTVLYGYSKKQGQDVGHAISGLSFPPSTGI